MTSFKIILGVLFGLLSIAVTFLGIVSYQYNEKVVKTSFWVNHTHEVIDKANKIASLYRDMQLESNAIIIIGDPSLATGYRRAERTIFAHIDTLRLLAGENIDQTAKIDSLQGVVMELAAFIDSVLTRSYVGSDSANKARFVVYKSLRSELNRIIGGFIDSERLLLEQWSASNEQNAFLFKRTFIGLLTGIAMMLGTTFFLIRHNFNKRIRAERKLRMANELFEKIFYESPIAMIITEQKTGKILNCNKVSCDLLNYSKGELVGKTTAQLRIVEVAEQGETKEGSPKLLDDSSYTETYIKPGAKDPLWVSIHRQFLNLYENNCILTAITDLSMHKRAEEDIRRALATEIELNKLKSNFVTLASHEFRTPLTTILSSSFLLEKYTSEENREKILKHLSRIRSSVNTLISILDEFLSITKIEEGGLRPHIEQLDVAAYLENACENMQAFAKSGQKIVYHHTGAREIYTDSVLLGNIINNLVSNAIKYSSEYSPINVSSSVNSTVRVIVKDAGIGIPREDQKHLFKRFYRASNAGSVQGTGLGLHIMKKYVDMLDGSINVKSELGKGTEVEIVFSPHPSVSA